MTAWRMMGSHVPGRIQGISTSTRDNMDTLCPVCGEVTETHYEERVTGYIKHTCTECGADKKQDSEAPV